MQWPKEKGQRFNDLQNTSQRLSNRKPTKNWGKLRYSKSLSSSCSTRGTRIIRFSMNSNMISYIHIIDLMVNVLSNIHKKTPILNISYIWTYPTSQEIMLIIINQFHVEYRQVGIDDFNVMIVRGV